MSIILNFSIFSYLACSSVLPLFLERMKAVGLGGLYDVSGLQQIALVMRKNIGHIIFFHLFESMHS